MGFEWVTKIPFSQAQVGGKIVVHNPEGCDFEDRLEPGQRLTISSIDGDWSGLNAKDDNGEYWWFSRDEFDAGYVTAEGAAMGFTYEGAIEEAVFEQVATSAEHPYLTEMRNAYDAVGQYIPPGQADIFKDALNNRYRSTAYRDHIKQLIALGEITQADVTEMRDILAGYRYTARTPNQKAWRYQWP